MTLSSVHALAAALDCVDIFYARIFRDWPEAETQTVGDCTLSYSGNPRLNGANHIWPHTPDALTEDALAQAEAFFEPWAASWSAIYTDTFQPLAGTFLREHGYYPRWNSPVMVLDGQPHPARTRPDTTVILASHAGHLHDMGRVMYEAFATSQDVNQRVARVAHLADDTILHYLIYEGRDPVACATVATGNGMAGIWNVGTRYKYRRQGYASTIMIALLDDLRARGFPVTMLMSSRDGRPLYDRLGYRQIGMTYYMGPPFRVVMQQHAE